MTKNRTRRRRATYVRPRREASPDLALMLITLVLLSFTLGLAAYGYVLVVWGGR